VSPARQPRGKAKASAEPLPAPPVSDAAVEAEAQADAAGRGLPGEKGEIDRAAALPEQSAPPAGFTPVATQAVPVHAGTTGREGDIATGGQPPGADETVPAWP
jgi:hypothetical protein